MEEIVEKLDDVMNTISEVCFYLHSAQENLEEGKMDLAEKCYGEAEKYISSLASAIDRIKKELRKNAGLEEIQQIFESLKDDALELPPFETMSFSSMPVMIVLTILENITERINREVRFHFDGGDYE